MNFVWSRLSNAAWEDAWAERLKVFEQRMAVIKLASGRSIRLEIYGLSGPESDLLKKAYGGQVRLQKQVRPLAPERPAIPIRDKLLITSKPQRASRRERTVISIPPAMAFGTGGHATTAGCLRFLCDLSKKMSGRWGLLDLGTGSGILAIAGEKLGAAACLAIDFDPQAVRAARENALLNGCTTISVLRRDVTRWEPRRRWNVVIANLYQSLLIGAAPAIANACLRGGRLIFSGILHDQERECVRALRPFFVINEKRRSGKWVIVLATRR